MGKRREKKMLPSLPVTEETNETSPKKNWEDLPFHIIQLIQSFLDDLYAVRSTLLCKSWREASSTSPNVFFHNGCPYSSSGLMDRTLVRYLRQNILVEKLHIFAFYGSLVCEYKDDELDQQVHRWLKFAYESRSLPRGVSGELPPRCSPLRILKLYHLRLVDERDFYAILSQCPLLEEIVLFGCVGVGRVVVTADYDRLRLFEIIFLGDDDLVEIFTPSLRSFSYGRYRDGSLPRNLSKHSLELQRARVINIERDRVFNIDVCRFLTDLSFNFVKIDDRCLDDMSRFMFLERLALDHCDLPTRTVIASRSLKKMKLLKCNCSMKELDIRCDSLSELSLSWRDLFNRWRNGNCNFHLRCSASPKMQLIVVENLTYPRNINNLLGVLKGLTSFCLEMNICLTRELLREREDNLLVDMRRIYGLPFTNVEAIWLDDMNDCPPWSLEVLFLAFHPTYIFSRWKSCCKNRFTKFLLSELMDRRKKCGCSGRWLRSGNSHKVSCWKHLLKTRRVMLRLSSNDDDGMWEPLKPASRWRRLVAGSQDLIGAHDIRFTLRWHKQIP